MITNIVGPYSYLSYSINTSKIPQKDMGSYLGVQPSLSRQKMILEGALKCPLPNPYSIYFRMAVYIHIYTKINLYLYIYISVCICIYIYVHIFFPFKGVVGHSSHVAKVLPEERVLGHLQDELHPRWLFLELWVVHLQGLRAEIDRLNYRIRS